jgi:hypothetical protein
MSMTNHEFKQVETVALDPEPDERGNVSMIVRLEDERSTALAFNVN